MKTFTIESKIEVTQEQIDDIMVTALEGGITYWCDEARIASSSNVDDLDYLSQEISNGGVLELHDAEEDKWHRLDLNMVLRALGKQRQFDFEQYDALDVDNVIQQAIFGEVIYG